MHLSTIPTLGGITSKIHGIQFNALGKPWVKISLCLLATHNNEDLL